MFRVILETEKGDIELRNKPTPEPESGKESVLGCAPTTEVVIISVGGKEYEVSKSDLNAAIKPFLYPSERLELV